MATTDPIADMLTRIRNALRNSRPQVTVLNSKTCAGIARVLKDEGFIEDFDVIEDNKQGLLRITLKYGERGEQIIHRLTRVSKPSCRVHRRVADLPRPLAGLGVAIVSTSSGVYSDRQCREKNVGGELLCTVE